MFISFYSVDGRYYQFAVNGKLNILTSSSALTWVESSTLQELKDSLSLIHPERDIEQAAGSILNQIMCSHPLIAADQDESYRVYFEKFLVHTPYWH